MSRPNRQRPGDWLTTDHVAIRNWIVKLKAKAAGIRPADYIAPVKALRTMVAHDPVLHASTQAMFVEALAHHKDDPTGAPAVTSWDEFLGLLNAVHDGVLVDTQAFGGPTPTHVLFEVDDQRGPQPPVALGVRAKLGQLVFDELAGCGEVMGEQRVQRHIAMLHHGARGMGEHTGHPSAVLGLAM